MNFINNVYTVVGISAEAIWFWLLITLIFLIYRCNNNKSKNQSIVSAFPQFITDFFCLSFSLYYLFALHLQVPSLLIVVFISHSHPPLLHLHTVLHCHIVLHTWQSCIIFLFLFSFLFIYFYLFIFIYLFILCRGWSPCTTMLSLSFVHYRNR